jgi:hypothetical protein
VSEPLEALEELDNVEELEKLSPVSESTLAALLDDGAPAESELDETPLESPN